jgi:hypothetical protein
MLVFVYRLCHCQHLSIVSRRTAGAESRLKPILGAAAGWSRPSSLRALRLDNSSVIASSWKPELRGVEWSISTNRVSRLSKFWFVQRRVCSPRLARPLAPSFLTNLHLGPSRYCLPYAPASRFLHCRTDEFCCCVIQAGSRLDPDALESLRTDLSLSLHRRLKLPLRG